jgi:hypothetical protein
MRRDALVLTMVAYTRVYTHLLASRVKLRKPTEGLLCTSKRVDDGHSAGALHFMSGGQMRHDLLNHGVKVRARRPDSRVTPLSI